MFNISKTIHETIDTLSTLSTLKQFKVLQSAPKCYKALLGLLMKFLGDCQRAIFRTILNLHFPKLASPILTIATPLNTKPLTPLYLYPLYVQSHQEEQRTILPLEKTMVQLCSVSLWDIQPSKSNKCLSIAKGFDNYC